VSAIEQEVAAGNYEVVGGNHEAFDGNHEAFGGNHKDHKDHEGHPAAGDLTDAPSATGSEAPIPMASHLLDESPLFELVTESGGEDQSGAGLGGEDAENYIELDLSEFLDEPGQGSAETAAGANAATEPEVAEIGAPVAGEPSSVEAAADELGDIAASAPESVPAEEDDWLEVVAALRRDVERLDAAPAGVKAAKPLKKLPRKLKGKPVQDEWGFFDPEQCGFAALLAKLDEVTAADEPGRRRKRA
jgi:hypothetical protein